MSESLNTINITAIITLLTSRYKQLSKYDVSCLYQAIFELIMTAAHKAREIISIAEK